MHMGMAPIVPTIDWASVEKMAECDYSLQDCASSIGVSATQLRYQIRRLHKQTWDQFKTQRILKTRAAINDVILTAAKNKEMWAVRMYAVKYLGYGVKPELGVNVNVNVAVGTLVAEIQALPQDKLIERLRTLETTLRPMLTEGCHEDNGDNAHV